MRDPAYGPLASIASGSATSWSAPCVRRGIEADIAPLIDAHGDGPEPPDFARPLSGSRAQGRLSWRRAVTRWSRSSSAPSRPRPLSRQAPIVARAIARHLASGRKPLDIQVTATATAVSTSICAATGPLRDRDRAGLIELGRRARLGTALAARGRHRGASPADHRDGRAAVVPPPGSFLQATTLGEETLTGLVVEACGRRQAGGGPVLRLRSASPCGSPRRRKSTRSRTIGHPWRPSTGPRGRRRACAGSRPRSATCSGRPAAHPRARRVGGRGARPAAGRAEAQVRQIAASKAPLVVSVSCDPGTLRARCRDPDRGRLPDGAGRPGRSVRAQPPYRTGRRAATRRSEEASMRLTSAPLARAAASVKTRKPAPMRASFRDLPRFARRI